MFKKFPPKKQDNSHIIRPNVKHVWSPYQRAIFKEIAQGEGNLIVIARAGSSKTSCLVEGAKYIPKGKKSLFCAFNKSIQEELKNRLPHFVEAMTLHSLGFRGIKQRFGPNVELDNNKCWNITSDLVGKENYDLIENLVKAVGLCKVTLTDIPSKIEELLIEYDIDLCECKLEIFIKYIINILRICKEKTNVIDFNDMIYFPFVYHINVGKHDYVFLDEGHDIGKCQLELALSAVRPGGRVIVVIDPRQAIYAFSGADSKILDNLRTRLSPKELSLPICYRCPKKVVELAQTIVPDILPYENAIDGEIININVTDLQKYVTPGCYVISRVNAPLVHLCMSFLKNNIPSNILGRDIGNGLFYLIKKSKKKKVSDLLKWLVSWEKQEKENLLIKYPKGSTEYISDKAECIRMLCEDASSVEDVKKNIDNLFKENDESKIVLCSSIHRAKGKECDDVFILEDTLRSNNEVENNLRYVAFTRAKKKLYLVRKTSKYNQYDDQQKSPLELSLNKTDFQEKHLIK